MSSKLFKKVVRAYAAGEVIFEQGSAVDGIYSVQTGRVSVYKIKPALEGYAEIELVQLGPGSMFGEMGMLDQTVRDASVKAIEFTEVLIITKEMFEYQMTQLPAWIVNFIKILLSRLRNTNNKLASALQLLEANGLKLPEDKPDKP
ncbi:MAG: Crp/Fnr family transcriptional regulator [Fibrobacteria bacterium]